MPEFGRILREKGMLDEETTTKLDQAIKDFKKAYFPTKSSDEDVEEKTG